MKGVVIVLLKCWGKWIQEVTKFINAANETKAASKAAKEGAQLRLVKAPADGTSTGGSSKRPKGKAVGKKWPVLWLFLVRSKALTWVPMCTIISYGRLRKFSINSVATMMSVSVFWDQLCVSPKLCHPCLNFIFRSRGISCLIPIFMLLLMCSCKLQPAAINIRKS